ncbi:MAG: hypothetical protein ACTSO9_02395 [Candidatus Helarchaeota archaeon]
MFRKIVRFWENSSVYSFIKDMEKIFFESRATNEARQEDTYAYLKKYELEVIKGIGPKTKTKLENFGIMNAYDLINCQTIQGISESKINLWKQYALALH